MKADVWQKLPCRHSSSSSLMPKNPRPFTVKLEDVILKREREAKPQQQQQQQQQQHKRHKLQRCCSDDPEAVAPAAAAAAAAAAAEPEVSLASAAAQLQEALLLGHVSSRAPLAWMLAFGRQGVAKDRSRAFELADQGARLGCNDCQGMVALCRALGYGCPKDAALALQLARASALAGSK